MMHMEHRMVQTQSQRLMLTQKMQQALKVLQLSGIELQEYVQQELETNPVLDLKADDVDAAIDKAAQEKQGNSTEGHDAATYDDGTFDLDKLENRWDQKLKEGRDFSINREAAERRDHYQNSITKEQSFMAMLMGQLRLAFEDETRLRIGEYIIGDIDDRGYFTGSVEEIANALAVTAQEVERVLFRIQRFEPTGIGARDVVECLLLQVNAEFPNNRQLRDLVEYHLEDLQHRHIPKIAKAMGIAPEEVEDLKTLLANLDPWPGREFSGDPPQFIAADLVVEKVNGDWNVRLTNDAIPSLSINDDYKNLVKTNGMDRDDKSYLRQKFEAARWLIKNIEQRQNTILRIGTAIADVQREFLDHGVEKMKPLTLQEIADRVGVHEATVSRTTRGKYMQTSQGLFELKYFFSPGLRTNTGVDQSSKSVQLLIKNIVEEEDKRKPLSDQKISDRLKESGIKIARRTVTKYREGLNISATTMRREY